MIKSDQKVRASIYLMSFAFGDFLYLQCFLYMPKNLRFKYRAGHYSFASYCFSSRAIITGFVLAWQMLEVNSVNCSNSLLHAKNGDLS